MQTDVAQMILTLQVTAQYAPAVLQTISNPDGTVSIIQVDPNNPIITLPDGTTAHVQGVATVSIHIICIITIKISTVNLGYNRVSHVPYITGCVNPINWC